jgi:hypothetical protein
MEKLGVDVDATPGTKTAETETSKQRLCPNCGSSLRSSEEVSISVCPKCGTQPFERPR